MRNSWRPCKIEVYYKKYPAVLQMWKFLQMKEETSVPFYADSPIAMSQKFPTEKRLKGINRNNFRPNQKYEQLVLLAELLGMKSIANNHEIAFKQVVNHLRKKNKSCTHD